VRTGDRLVKGHEKPAPLSALAIVTRNIEMTAQRGRNAVGWAGRREGTSISVFCVLVKPKRCRLTDIDCWI